MTGRWLQDYLTDAVARNVCTQIYCTTCGAMEFRRGVLAAFAQSVGQAPLQGLSRESAIEIAKALAEVDPPPDSAPALEPAVRCLLFELWSGVPLLDSSIESALDGTWGGGVLARMKAHHHARIAARRAHWEFQQGATARREEKKRIRQEQHQKRLVLKRERDRIWREKQGKAESE